MEKPWNITKAKEAAKKWFSTIEYLNVFVMELNKVKKREHTKIYNQWFKIISGVPLRMRGGNKKKPNSARNAVRKGERSLS